MARSGKGANTAGWEASRRLRLGLLIGFTALILGFLVFSFLPRPVEVDLVVVERGGVEVRIAGEGRTRLREPYEVDAPVVGLLRRPELRAGDPVRAGDPLLRIDPPEALLRDGRTRAQLQARLEGARADEGRARSAIEAAQAAVVEVREVVREAEVRMREGAGSSSDLERARALLSSAEARERAARAGAEMAAARIRGLEAELAEIPSARPEGPGPVTLAAPVDGRVLRVHRENGGPVTPGEPLLEVGDVEQLELVVELPSERTLGLRPGLEARVTGWGGDPLGARVREVEPSGFSRVSVLGLEVQRVRVVLDPSGEAEWRRLGPGYRVEITILAEEGDDGLRVPVGTAVPRPSGWAVYRATGGGVVGGRLEEIPVEVGRRNRDEVELVSGVDEGDLLVRFPSDRVRDGVRFVRRR